MFSCHLHQHCQVIFKAMPLAFIGAKCNTESRPSWEHQSWLEYWWEAKPACRVADDIPYYRNAGTQATTCGGNAQECNSVWNRVSMLWPTCTSPPLSVPLESLQGIWRWGCFGVFCELTVSFCGCDLCLSSLLLFLYALALHHPHQRITFSQSLHLGLTCGWGKKFVYGLI